MIIEGAEIQSSAEDGNSILVTGRSLESMLTRRIVWETTDLDGSLQDGVKKLLEDAIIKPTIAARKIENFVFVDSVDPVITELTLEQQVEMGAELYKTIVEICESKKIGFKIVLTDDGCFEFSLYAGADRSYNQLDNPYVVFSPEFENIVNSNYLDSNKNLKTVTLVAGDDTGSTRITRAVELESGGGSGLQRREMYSDAGYFRRSSGGVTLSEKKYNALLDQIGRADLAENAAVVIFDGETDTTMFSYGQDFFMGDIVQLENEYGAEARTRVVEVIISDNDEGTKVYPVFTVIEQNEEKE